MCWLQLWYIPIDFSGSGVRCTDHRVVAFFFFFLLRTFGAFHLLLFNIMLVSCTDSKKLLAEICVNAQKLRTKQFLFL